MMRLNILTKCWAFYQPYKLEVYVKVISRILTTVVSVIIPIAFAEVIDNLLSETTEKMIYYFVLLMLLYIFRLLLNCLAASLNLRLEANTRIRINQYYLDKLLNIPIDQVKEYNDGRLFSFINNDTTGISQYFNTAIEAIMLVLNIASIGIITFYINWRLSFVLVLVYPVSFFMNRYYRNRVKSQSEIFYGVRDKFYSYMKKVLSNIESIIIIRGASKIHESSLEITSELFLQDRLLRKYKVENSLMLQLLNMINYFVLIGFGLYLVQSASLSLGELIAFTSYSKALTLNLDKLMTTNVRLQPAIVSIERLREIEDKANYEPDNVYMLSDDGVNAIEIFDASFKYDLKQVFVKLTLNFEKGKLYGIKGGNGSGKSSLVKMLLSVNIPSDGAIFIDDIPINKLAQSNLFKHMSLSTSNYFQVYTRIGTYNIWRELCLCG